MSHETAKATARRRRQDLGCPPTEEFWDSVFKGKGVDIGAGDDPLVWPSCSVTSFDLPTTTDYPADVRGDANFIDDFFKENSQDFVHGSQVAEHLHDPLDAIMRMIKIVKPGGWVILTVPDFDLYEKRVFPSKFNGDHKSTWSLWRQIPPNPRFPHICVPHLREALAPHLVEAALCDTNYDYMDVESDQTWLPEKGVEAFIEIRIQKANA